MAKRKRIRVHKRTLLLIDAILVSVMVVALIALLSACIHYARDRRAYAEVRAAAVSTPAPTYAPLPTPIATANVEQAALETAQAPAETPPIAVDFAAVRAEGRHVRGWLYSVDTIINYPVVYYTNNTYYLTRDYTGSGSKAGALFFDARATKDLLGDNLIIYGHHMKDRSMFGSLMQYQKQSYYEAHPTLYLLLENANYRVDLFAARFVDSEAKYFPTWFASAEEKKAFVQSALSESTFTPADTAFYPEKRILTLSTCAYSNYVEDAKYLVYGWLTEIG